MIDPAELSYDQDGLLPAIVQDAGKLVGQQNKQEHRSDRKPGLDDLAENISIEYTSHRYIGDFAKKPHIH
ncbi:MAG: hypothetical protein IIB76_09845 [Proteobacteria bacterium]|nr:hypothetical protein [Pseudomonadota bacterium]